MKAPAIGSHIEIYPYDNKYNIFNKNTGKTFLIGEKEGAVLISLDGTKTVEELHQSFPFYSKEDIQKLLQAFNEIVIFNSKKTFNLLKMKKRLFNPNRIFKSDSAATKLLFILIIVICPILLTTGIVINAAANIIGGNSTTHNIISEYLSFNWLDLVILFFSSISCLALHEFAHTVTARRYNVNVPEIGIMLYWFMPAAYTNISGINLLKSKKQKIIVLISGTLVNLGLVGTFYILINTVSNIHLKAFFLALIIVNLGTVFTNGMIFLKFDSYYILETIFDETNLREKAKIYLFSLIRKGTKTNEEIKSEFDAMPSSKKTMYIAYALISMAYIPILVINLIVSILPFFIGG